MKLIPIFILFFLSNSAYASLFGPSNYEECMNDGKVGRNLSEIQLKNKECRKKFPKLPSVAKGLDKLFTCVWWNGDVSTHRLYKSKNIVMLDNVSFPLKYINDESIVFGDNEVLIEINYLSGNGKIKDKKYSDSTLKCFEK